MGTLAEEAVWEEGVHHFEADAVLTGGPDCPDNLPLQDLTNRTAWLKEQVETAQGGLAAHEADVNPHPQYATDADLANHAGAADPHPVYLTSAEGDLSYIRRFTTGISLPITNIGPIWHDDYASVMTWQTFNANGAAYTGYASLRVGSLLMDTQPTPRPGYIKSGTSNLSRAAYAALRGWAMHNGIMVAAGVWAAGTIAVKDNVDGLTFTIFDIRGEFPRLWDDGRGIDIGRVFGTGQASQNLSHNHGLTLSNGAADGGHYPTNGTSTGSSYSTVDPILLNGGTEARSRNVPFLAAVKY